MEQKVLSLEDLCRFCLSNKCSPYSLISLSERHAKQFKDLTRRELPLNDYYPQNACVQCCRDLENMHCYKTLMLQKQDELDIILQSISVAEEYIVEDEIIEEYLDEENDGDNEHQEAQDLRTKFSEMPSVKNLSQTPNKTDILKLIEDIEKNNQLIYENSKPTILWKKRKSRTDKIKTVQFQSSQTPVIHNEDHAVQIPQSHLLFKPYVDSSDNQVILMDEKKQYKAESDSRMIAYHDKTYICSYGNCSDSFNSEFLLKRHHKSHPTESLMCCDQIFNTYQDYKHHKRTTHEQPVKCACGKVLKNQKTYRIHLKSHLATSERQYKCDKKNCFKAFNMKVHLENHLRIHNNHAPFECPLPQCTAAFKQKHQIKLHLRNKHASNTVSSSEIDETSLE